MLFKFFSHAYSTRKTNNRFLILHDPFPAFTDRCLPAENFITYHYLNFRKVRGTLVFYSDPKMIDYSAAT